MASTIERKALPRREPVVAGDKKLGTLPSVNDSPDEIQKDLSNDRNAKIEAPTQEGELRPDLDEQLENLQLETKTAEPLSPLTDAAITEEPNTIIDEPVTFNEIHGTAPKPSKLKTALGEVKHFAGGLVSHPYEATKHFSILRHSHGLVFYQGPTTSVAITMFSDQPLPEDRKLWLQKRGFSGRTGLQVGAAVGSRSAWIDVTPVIDASADLLPKGDERAWQRDINKFSKKTKTTKNLCRHRPYETNVVRIPHVAEDGYFRIVVCSGRKVLCPSPVFRYASSSLDPSIVRGASLSTLPMELGIRIGSMVARNAANTAAHGAVQPMATAVQNATKPYQLDGLTQWAAATAYDASGAADRVDGTLASVNQSYGERRDFEFTSVSGDSVAGAEIVGMDDGPEKPYPIRLSDKVVQGGGKCRVRFGVPTANLANIPNDTLLRLSGTYMGWASIARTKASQSSTLPDEMYEQWLQAVIMVLPEREKQAKVVEQKNVSVYILFDFDEATFFDAKLDLMLMAFLHPPTPEISIEQQQQQMLTDIASTQGSLQRPAWAPDATLERIKSASSTRSMTERMADARQVGQKQIDRIPVHKLGVRTDSMGLKDQLVGNGGICVKR